jgi:hypothetical protein
MAYAFFVLINNTGAGGHRRRLVKNIGGAKLSPIFNGVRGYNPWKRFLKLLILIGEFSGILLAKLISQILHFELAHSFMQVIAVIFNIS